MEDEFDSPDSLSDGGSGLVWPLVTVGISKMTRARTTSIPGTLSLVALVSLDLI